MSKKYEPITKENRKEKDPYNIYPDGYIPYSHPRWTEIPVVKVIGCDPEDRTLEEIIETRKKFVKLLNFNEEQTIEALRQAITYWEITEGKRERESILEIGELNKTEIIIHLAEEAPGVSLDSRSLAKKILSNADKFEVIFLDFKNIDTIGEDFADEIFRVFKKKNPEAIIVPVNDNEEVTYMINRASLIAQI